MVQSTTWQVIQIQNKHTHWLQEATKRIQTYHPIESGFELVNVGGNNEEDYDFSVLFKALDSRREHAEKLIDIYRTHPLPVAIFAAMANTDSIDAWTGLRHQTEIVCCEGTGHERDLALNTIDNHDGYIIDPLTLFTIYLLGVHKEINIALGCLKIVQSSIDILISKAQSFNDLQPSAVMRSEGNGNYSFSELNNGDNNRQKRIIQDLIHWTTQHCEIIPAIGNPPNYEGWEKVVENVEPWFLDTMLAAANYNYALFTEDHRYRLFAKSLYDTEGIWIQIALGVAVEKGAISITKYSQSIGDLILKNHSLVGVSSFDLTNMLIDNQWENSERFNASISSLQKRSLDIKSVITVAAQFIQMLWEESNHSRIKYTNIVLHSITKSRPELTRFILRCMVRLTKFIPDYAREDYLNSIKSWGVGHFLYAPDNFFQYLNKDIKEEQQ
jgi:hypothetical protein